MSDEERIPLAFRSCNTIDRRRWMIPRNCGAGRSYDFSRTSARQTIRWIRATERVCPSHLTARNLSLSRPRVTTTHTLTSRALGQRIRQQELLAELGVLALQGTSFMDMLNHAARITAEGLEAEYCNTGVYPR